MRLTGCVVLSIRHGQPLRMRSLVTQCAGWMPALLEVLH